LDERRRARTNKRRGRKNKYYAQIDQEDDHEVGSEPQSDPDQDLQMIKEQEEEEENMKKAINAEKSKAAQEAEKRKKQ
jgi:hypothetical protein